MSHPNLLQTLCSGKLISVHPLPSNHDPLNPLLQQHFPAHSRPARLQAGLKDGEFDGIAYDRAFEQLRGKRRWRALADLTANELTNGRQKASTEGEAVRSALHLWSIRFGCLRRLGFYSIMASESAGLFSTLGTPFHSPLPAYNPDKPTLNQTYNLHLLQLWAISPLFVGGDRFLVIKQLREVMHGCKYEFWRTQQHTWKDGVLSTSLILANLCLDMQEYEQVDRILAAILAQNKDIDTLTHSILFYLDMGDIVRAQQMLDELLTLPEGKTRRALLDRILLLARDEQTGTEEASLSEEPDSLVGQNNAAVSCLYSGRIREGIEILESQSRKDPAEFFNEETSISALLTLQDLQSGDQLANKLSLLRETSKYASESIRPDCLRL